MTEFIVKNPIPAVLIAFGVGFLGGGVMEARSQTVSKLVAKVPGGNALLGRK